MTLLRSKRRVAPFAGTLLAVSVLLTAIWSTVEAATPSLSAQSAVAGVGQTVAIPINLSEAPSGVSGYNITVSMSNPGVANIDAVDLPDFGLTSVTHNSSSEVNIQAVDLNTVIRSGAVNPTLSTLTMQTLKTGSTDFVISVTTLDNDGGFPIGAAIMTGTLNVKKKVSGSGSGGGGSNGGGGKGKNR